MDMIKDKNVNRFIIVSALVMIIFSVFSYSSILNAKEDLYKEKIVFLSETSKKNAILIETKVEDLLNKLESISSIITSRDEKSYDKFIKVLQEQAELSEFKRMGIILPSGKAITSDGFIFDFSEREYFKTAMQGKSYVSDTFSDQADGKEINVFSTPIYEGERIIAVLFASKETSAMSELLSVTDFEGNGHSYIIKQTGIPVTKIQTENYEYQIENIFDAYEKENGKNENFKQFKADIQEGRNSSLSLIYDGDEKQVTYTKTGINDWYVVTIISLNYIASTSQNLIVNILIYLTVFLIILLIVGLTLIQYFNQTNNKLQRIAYIDDVTGFSNEKKFNSVSTYLLMNNPKERYAFIVFDVKQFKLINDLFGYHQGSALLKHIAKQCSEIMRKDECFGRTSADYFCMLLKYRNNQEIIDRLNQLSKSIQHFIDGYYIEVNYGIYMIDESTYDIGMFRDRANISKNIAKHNSEINYSFYDDIARSTMIHEKRIENVMERGIKNREFEVYLQPKILLSNNQVIGSEALVRWNQSEMGMIYPNDFIPLFEKNGFIKELDLYMFQEVCKILRTWKNDELLCKQRISVNLSRNHLNNEHLVDEFVQLTRVFQVNPEFIEIELTESAKFMDNDKIITIMKRFKEEGFTLSIDDFGNGYSSLNTLKDLPVDIIKLDRGFLNEATDNERSKVIIISLITMIKTLSLQSVAEGVETKKQLDFLRAAGCDIVQGHYYAKAMTVNQFEAYCTNKSKEMDAHQ